MIPFDWFRTKKQRLLIQQTELNNEIETLKLEESVLARRDERDKLAVRVKAHRLVRTGNGSVADESGIGKGLSQQRQTGREEAGSNKEREHRVEVSSVSARKRSRAERTGGKTRTSSSDQN